MTRPWPCTAAWRWPVMRSGSWLARRWPARHRSGSSRYGRCASPSAWPPRPPSWSCSARAGSPQAAGQAQPASWRCWQSPPAPPRGGGQGAAVRRLGQMSSTYLTSTLTGIVAGLVTRQRPAGLGRSLGSLAAIVVGAAGSSVVAADVPDWLPLLVLAPLAAVLAYSLRLWQAPAADIS